MPDLLFSVEVAVGVLVALVVAYVLLMVGRRRAIGRGRVLTMCAVQAEGMRHWRSGFVRFGNGVVEWYPLGGISLRPRHQWERADLDVSAQCRSLRTMRAMWPRRSSRLTAVV